MNVAKGGLASTCKASFISLVHYLYRSDEGSSHHGIMPQYNLGRQPMCVQNGRSEYGKTEAIVDFLKCKATVDLRDMGKQLWDFSLRVDDKVERRIDFKHIKWGCPITVKVRAANC